MSDRPGGGQAARPLQVIWVLDRSASMAAGGKVEALNAAVRGALAALEDADRENPFAQLLVRALVFSDDVEWTIADPTPPQHVRWADVRTYGRTSMGLALATIAAELEAGRMTRRGFPPVIVLVSDGRPTDDFDAGLRALMGSLWGPKAVRVAIAIGADADLDVLQTFIGLDSDIPPLLASNPGQLVAYLKWASTVPAAAVSQPRPAEGLGSGYGTPEVPEVRPGHDPSSDVTW
jgi:uncharacterized protein YegL